MISPENFYFELKKKNVNFFAGVPDSLLKNFCNYITDNCNSREHIIAANEGNAIGLATGHYLATKSIPVVYMQNSGLGNSVNPLASLANSCVYGIPMLLVIGWRGEPEGKDEPQHCIQGNITLEQLSLLNVATLIVDADSNLTEIIHVAFNRIKENCSPVALLVRKGTFSSWQIKNKSRDSSDLKREEALHSFLESLSSNDLIVSTTGKTSRELYELRDMLGMPINDFYVVGSMGHASSISLGIALSRPDKRVFCFDGDGSLLMHMGAVPIIGYSKCKNLVHVVFNNSAHESVGGHPTVAGSMDFSSISKACGYLNYMKAENINTLQECISKIDLLDGPIMLEVIVKQGSRDDLERPTTSLSAIKDSFMEKIRG